jgi:hypothetical protein
MKLVRIPGGSLGAGEPDDCKYQIELWLNLCILPSGTSYKNFMRLQLKHFHQAEPHTCGWCACHVLYQYYGITNTKHLRTALKVDAPVISRFPSSTGVLPWVMLRVLRLDGFLLDFLPLNQRSLTTICLRLEQGHPTIALEGNRDSLHWNVIGGHSNDYLHIMDSLSPTPGWWRLSKEEAVGHFNMFLSVTSYDGRSRRTTTLEKLKAVPSLRKLWKMCWM